jgi:heme ABC exporter ATP-binding subunit CcmA
MGDWAIETSGLVKRYGREPVLRGIELRVKPGESVVMFGANGAGKSTLIRILCTLARPSGGSARVGGYDVTEEPDGVRACIGLLAHSTHLYEDLTAFENVRFYLRLRGAPHGEARALDALKAVGLARVVHNRARTFSAGMKKRLSLARIMAHPPAVLFLDEPYSGLDSQGIEMLNRFLRARQMEGGTIFMATHHREQGLAAGERVLYLSGGVLSCEPPTGGDG